MNTEINNNETTNPFITNMIAYATPVFEAAHNVCSSRPMGSRIPSKDLSEIIAKEAGLPFAEVSGLLHFFLRNTYRDNLGYISLGKNGGWIRGTKKAVNDTRKTSISKQEVSNAKDIAAAAMYDKVISELSTSIANDTDVVADEENDSEEVAV